MTIKLNTEQQLSLERGEAVSCTDPDTGNELVVLRGVDYRAVAEMLEEERSKCAIARVALQAATRWAQDNPY
jgi:hypothetical protein